MFAVPLTRGRMRVLNLSGGVVTAGTERTDDGVVSDGRLFRNEAGNYVDTAVYGATWSLILPADSVSGRSVGRPGPGCAAALLEAGDTVVAAPRQNLLAPVPVRGFLDAGSPRGRRDDPGVTGGRGGPRCRSPRPVHADGVRGPTPHTTGGARAACRSERTSRA